MRTRSDGEETRGKILQTACEVFGELGYHKATFAEMGRRGAFSPTLISFHFRSKDELYQKVWGTLQERVRQRWPADGGLPEDAPAADRLKAHIRSTLNRLCDPDLVSLHHIDMQERVNATGLVERDAGNDIRQRREHMRSVLRELLGKAASEEVVDLCEMSVLHQLFVMRRPWGRDGRQRHRRQAHHGPHGQGEHHDHLPRFSPDDVDRLTAHITRFSLGGIAAVRQAVDNPGTSR